MRKKAISILILIAFLITLLPTSAFAEGGTSGYTPDEAKNVVERYQALEPDLKEYYLGSTHLSYWKTSNDLFGKDDNGYVKWRPDWGWEIQCGAWFLGKKLGEEEYTQILADLITFKQSNNIAEVDAMLKVDKKKGIKDYVYDVVDLVCIGAGLPEKNEKVVSLIAESWAGVQHTDKSINLAKYAITTVKDYGEAKQFLEAVSKHTQDQDLKNAAEILIQTEENLYEQKMKLLRNHAEKQGTALRNFGIKTYWNEFTVNGLKMLEKAIKNPKLATGVLCMKGAATAYAWGELAFRITILVGDICWGTSDVYYRAQEMEVLSEISRSLCKELKTRDIDRELSETSDFASLKRTCDLYKYLITTHSRGEYCLYRLLTEDAKKLSEERQLNQLYEKSMDPKKFTDEEVYKMEGIRFQTHIQMLDDVFHVTEEDIVHGIFDPDLVPREAADYGHHKYYLYEKDFDSFVDAAAFCEEQGGYPASITSAKEQKFVEEYMETEECSGCYIGLLTDASTERAEWWNQEEVDYVNWGTETEASLGDGNTYLDLKKGGNWYSEAFRSNEAEDSEDGKPRAILCEWGEYDKAPLDTPKREKDTEGISGTTDIALTLDCSGSMTGKPIRDAKEASYQFIKRILDQEGTRMGFSTFDEYIESDTELTAEPKALSEAVTDIRIGGGTNIEAGLNSADDILSASSAGRKYLVLMSDGVPNYGLTGEELISCADGLKDKGYTIFTLGFYVDESTQSMGSELLKAIASEGFYYEVNSSEDMIAFFEDIADMIKGQRYMYLEIACPVDVEITKDGETLTSVGNTGLQRTNFGTMTCKNTEGEMASSEETESGGDRRIKILRLKEGSPYDLQITGNGSGQMDYTVSFMDEEGDYTDVRTFKNVQIEPETVVDTVVEKEKTSRLDIDSDGDGTYDKRMEAGENDEGEEVEIITWKNHVVNAVVAVLLFTGFAAFLIHRRKSRKRQ